MPQADVIQTEVIQTRFQRYDSKPIYKDSIIRLKTDEGMFFCYLSQFEDTKDALDNLQDTATVTMGAHKLKNGGYWLHWLMQGQHILLKPQEVSSDISLYMKVMLGCLLVTLVSLGLLINSNENILISLLFLASLMFTCLSFKEVLSLFCAPFYSARQDFERINNPDNRPNDLLVKTAVIARKLSGYMEKVFAIIFPKKSDIEFDAENIDKTMLDDHGIEAIKIEVDRVDVETEQLSRTITAGKTRKTIQLAYNYHYIHSDMGTFECLTHDEQHDTTNKIQVFHPLFIAKGDKLEMLVESRKNTVIGIFNHEDNSAYTLEKDGYVDFSQTTTKDIVKLGVIFYFILLIIMLVMISAISFSWIAVGIAVVGCATVLLLIMAMILWKKQKYNRHREKNYFVKLYLRNMMKNTGVDNDVTCILNRDINRQVPFN